ncbi:ABC-type cobalt transport system [Magnetospirillum molischianum DSM 120]|uniref:ABC-type cobalt transport system n=1 Tax=Magnetospirillum molischianum DSM 120 TaxID=1150626 RepID=H8FW09_MAGML|nr:ABC-type cobalt transport system [Magnetospirillum molischianum DSM 120]
MLALGLLVLVLAVPPWPGAVAVLVIAWTAALAGARVTWRDWLRLVAAPLGFALTGAFALAIEIGPDGLALARDGGAAAAAVVIRAAAALSCLLLLAVTTPAPDLVRGARRLGLSPEIAEMALLIWRFLFMLLESATAIRHAQDARLGWHGFRRSIRSLGLLVALLLPRALDRAQRLECGLAARGFDGSLPMLSPRQPVSLRFIAATLGLQAAVLGVSLWWS